MGLRKLYIAGAFALSIVSCVLIIVSAATEDWVNADVWVQSNTSTIGFDYVNYGLYGGSVLFRRTVIPGRHTLYMTCVARACAVTCKTTAIARQREVIRLATGFRPASFACDTNTGINLQQPFLGLLPVIWYGIYVTVNLFLYLQLLFAVCSALLALVNLCINPTKSFIGLRGLSLVSCASALMGFLVLMIWGIHYGSSGFRHHLAFAYVAGQVSNAYSSLGYSYWVLLPAVLCSIGSTTLAHIRNFIDRNSVK